MVHIISEASRQVMIKSVTLRQAIVDMHNAHDQANMSYFCSPDLLLSLIEVTTRLCHKTTMIIENQYC